jgi:hypothetical protein
VLINLFIHFFSLRYVDIYANDIEKFFTDFTAAFNKLEELGTKNLTKQNWAGV